MSAQGEFWTIGECMLALRQAGACRHAAMPPALMNLPG